MLIKPIFSSTDTQAELQLVRKSAVANGAFAASIATHWSDGGPGAAELADALIEACESSKSNFKFLYELDMPIEDKIVTIAKEMYGAGSVEFAPKVRDTIRAYTEKVSCNITLFLRFTRVSFRRALTNCQFVWPRHPTR